MYHDQLTHYLLFELRRSQLAIALPRRDEGPGQAMTGKIEGGRIRFKHWIGALMVCLGTRALRQPADPAALAGARP